MRIVYYPDSRLEQGRYVATIGFFDGVHKGHRFVIDNLKSVATVKECESMLITFERHPRLVVHSDWQPQLLTTLEERIQLLAQTGVDMLVVLRFDEAMAALSARDFMSKVLHDDLCVTTLLTGYDNRFGHDRSAGFDDYVAFGKQVGIEVMQSVALDVDQYRVSSSVIRRLLTDGDVSEAAHCLGRYYSLTGMVVHGEQVGRRIGFPTANVLPDNDERLVPASGVYAVLVDLFNNSDNSNPNCPSISTPLFGMMNIGTRPTFGVHHPTLEVNLLDFAGDVYGQRLRIRFVERLRSEQRFENPDALVAQIEKDCQQVRALLSALQ